MTLNNLIKNAISDKNLRGELLSNPVKTCKAYDIEADYEAFKGFEIHPCKNVAIIQGGYRP